MDAENIQSELKRQERQIRRFARWGQSICIVLGVTCVLLSMNGVNPMYGIGLIFFLFFVVMFYTGFSRRCPGCKARIDTAKSRFCPHCSVGLTLECAAGHRAEEDVGVQSAWARQESRMQRFLFWGRVSVAVAILAGITFSQIGVRPILAIWICAIPFGLVMGAMYTRSCPCCKRRINAGKVNFCPHCSVKLK